MKKLTFSLATLGLLTLMACGVRAEQKTAEEKQKIDSIATSRMKRIVT